MISRSRIWYAFFNAGITVMVGVAASSILQGIIRRDSGFFAVAWLGVLFGIPIVLGLLLAAFVVFLLARKANRVTQLVALVTGTTMGLGVGIVIDAPLLPVWASTLVGAAAGGVWWRTLATANPLQLPANTR
jgi:hypothetical protein